MLDNPCAQERQSPETSSSSICQLLCHPCSHCTGRSCNSYLLRRKKNFFTFHNLSPFPLLQTCFVKCEAISLVNTSWTYYTLLPELRCSSSSGTSSSIPSVQELQCSQLIIKLYGSTHSIGIICADSCSIRLEMLASATTLHSLSNFPSLLLSCISLLGDTAQPIGGTDCEVKWLCSCSSMSSGVFTVTVEGKK